MTVNCRACGIRYCLDRLPSHRPSTKSVCFICHTAALFVRLNTVIDEIRTTWDATVGTTSHRRAMNVLYCRRRRVMLQLDRIFKVKHNV
jgi:hypothetical protein